MFEELSLHLLDLAMNSLAAGAKTVDIRVQEDRARDRLVLQVRDDGRGMDAATLDRVRLRSRSTKPGRKKGLGLGLALLRQTCEMCGGRLDIDSAPGRGTTVTASMQWSHIDRPPLGDLQATLLALCAAHAEADIRLDYRANGQHLRFSSRELAANAKGAV